MCKKFKELEFRKKLQIKTCEKWRATLMNEAFKTRIYSWKHGWKYEKLSIILNSLGLGTKVYYELKLIFVGTEDWFDSSQALNGFKFCGTASAWVS